MIHQRDAIWVPMESYFGKTSGRKFLLHGVVCPKGASSLSDCTHPGYGIVNKRCSSQTSSFIVESVCDIGNLQNDFLMHDIQK